MSFLPLTTADRTRLKSSWVDRCRTGSGGTGSPEPVRRNRIAGAAILVLFFLSACARTGALPEKDLPVSVYDLVPGGKSPRFLAEFFVVDDFNSKDPKNLLGGPWKGEGAGLRFEFLPKDAFHQRRGNSLLFKLSQPARSEARFRSALKGLDLSQAQAVVLKCEVRSNGPFSGKIVLFLKDFSGSSGSADLTKACLGGKPGLNGWKEAVVGRAQLGPLDWNRLQEIGILVEAGEVPLQAEIGIDEIAFYGKGDVRFESHRDNLAGFPARTTFPERATELKGESETEKFLTHIARDTWKYFVNAIDQRTQLPVDHLRVGKPEDVGSYTTPTNLAMYFLSCVAAYELGFIPRKEAVGRIQKTLETLRRMKRWGGFFYNFYDTRTLEVTRPYVSVVDSGWLAAAWMVVRQAFPEELGNEAAKFLEEADFGEFYDPSNRQLRLGFDEEAGSFSPYHYGLLATEARVASFIGIGKGDLPREHWWSIYRVPPREWDWQNQVPEGKMIEVEGVPLFRGHYTYQGKKFIPSWGGSLFEFLMPSLVMKERERAPQGLGLNNRIATEIQIDYALNRQGYPIWGISPASVSTGRLWRYGEFGVKYLGVKGYRDEGIAAPYATFLALDSLPEQAVDNLRRLLNLDGIYGEYGFYDSVNVRNGRVNTQYLVLDQGMTLAALANTIKGGVLQNYFHQDPYARQAETLLQEIFFD